MKTFSMTRNKFDSERPGRQGRGAPNAPVALTTESMPALQTLREGETSYPQLM